MVVGQSASNPEKHQSEDGLRNTVQGWQKSAGSVVDQPVKSPVSKLALVRLSAPALPTPTASAAATVARSVRDPCLSLTRISRGIRRPPFVVLPGSGP